MGQQTIDKAVSVSGTGLHSGAPCTVQLQPAAPGSGIRFTDLSEPSAAAIPAHVDRVTDTRLATTLTAAGRSVQTVEHLLSAVRGLEVDNLEIAVQGPEVPVMDGTAEPWARALRSAGLVAQSAPRTVLVVDRTVRVTLGESWVEASPAKGLELQLTIDFDHPMVGVQELRWMCTEGAFEAELAWARTFGFERDVAALQRMGLIAGGSLDNALVFSEAGLLNEEGLRRPDEPVRHKAMDMLGDLALIGHPVRGRFTAARPGHGRVIALIRALMDDREAWHLETGGAEP